MKPNPASAKGIPTGPSGEKPRWVVPLTQMTLGEEEEEAVRRVLRRGWLSMGEEVEAFEHEFARMVGVRDAIAVTNGTHALHLAYEACGLKRGDAIALPALTFVAALNVALRMGLKPVLLDIESEMDLTPSNSSLERIAHETPNLRAVVAMPYGGWAPRMGELTALCKKRGITLIEDACHAVGATLGKRALGSFGAANAFSFFPNKNMTTGEGGMVCTNDASIAKRVRQLRSHGMTALTWDRHRGHASDYDVEIAGENYRMDEMRAALGRVQLSKLASANAARRNTARAIVRATRESTGPALKFPFHEGETRPSDETAAAHLLVALLPPKWDREKFREILSGNGVQTSVHYPPLYSFSHVANIFADARDECPVLASIEKRLVTLPLAPNFSTAQIEYLTQALEAAVNAMSTRARVK